MPKGTEHFLDNDDATLKDQSHYMIAFYKLHIEDDERYRPYLYGDQ
jgi:hypothetical protein